MATSTQCKVCKSVHHRTIQINHQKDATIFHFIILTFIYSSTCFGRFPAHHQELNDCSGSLWFYIRIVVTAVLCSWSGRQARPRTQHVVPVLFTFYIQDGMVPVLFTFYIQDVLKFKCKTPVPKG